MRPLIVRPRRALCRIAVLAAPLLVLAACSGSNDKTATAKAAAPAVLGGVDLNQTIRALGTEPFWSVEIKSQAGAKDSSGITFTGMDRDPQHAAAVSPVIQGTTAVYATTTDDGSAMTVTLIATECSDGMSDRVYPLTAKVVVGEGTVVGCAISQAALDALPPA